eukprot:TRINITY_DN6822_c0_g2_i1.p1 TRINITY_DN6822_c0_g2~~TRINITY_DN6822_c0_g2_i1.p1  ORF type:complete len:688 (-),score=111.32 TRINITY_DN6822_c0_g2_i1:887-2950(-)
MTTEQQDVVMTGGPADGNAAILNGLAEVLKNPVKDAYADLKVKMSNAFSAFESQRSVLETITIKWKDIESVFDEREKCLNERELLVKSKELDAEELYKKLEAKEAEIATKEAAAAMRVQELKDAAIAAVAEEKRKGEVIKSTPEAITATQAATKAGAASTTTTQAPTKSGPAATTATKPSPAAALAAQAAAAAAVKSLPLTKIATKAGASKAEVAEPAVSAAPVASPKVAANDDSAEPLEAEEAAGKVENSKPKKKRDLRDVPPRPELKALCERQDGPGLLKFLVVKHRDLNALRTELPSALQLAIDPAMFVLKTLEDHATGSGDEKKDHLSTCKMIITVLEAFATISEIEAGKSFVISASAQDYAKKLADQWIASWPLSEASSFYDARKILQLIAAFNISSRFPVDDLFKFVVITAKQWRSSALYRSLGMTDKIPELVETLAKEGKQVDGLRLARDFGILDKFQPVTMLRAFLKDAKKNAQAILKIGKDSTSSQNESTTREIGALRLVLKCIAELKLEEKFSSEPLKKRIAELEKAKADRKRQGVPAHPQQAPTKRARANDVSPANASRYGQGNKRPSYTSPPNPSTYQNQTISYTSGQPATMYGGATTYDRRTSTSAPRYASSSGAASTTYVYTTDPAPQPQAVFASSAYAPGTVFAAPETSYGTTYRYTGSGSTLPGTYTSYGH